MPQAVRPRSRFVSKRDGIVALEFALIAPVLIMVVVWIFEFAVLMIRQQAVDYASAEAARLVRTGMAQNSANPKETVANGMCEASFGWLDCSRLELDVRNYPNFAAIDLTPPVYDKDGKITNFVFQPGGPTSVMFVRVSYPHELITPILSSIFTKPVNLRSNAVVRGEPWA